MISEGTRRFDLYDFFSVLIPGGTFLIGIMPFLPREANVFSFGAVAAAIVLSIVFGRGLHATGILLETPVGGDKRRLSVGKYDIGVMGVTTGHRDYFTSQIHSPTSVSDGLVSEFYNKAIESFPELDLPVDRNNINSDHEAELETLYTVVRSQIHMDARGRSRTFQAILDFQRTMVITSLALFGIYSTYAVLQSFNPGQYIGYETYISYLGFEWWLILIGSIIVPLLSYTIFERVRSSYRIYFIQYLMADFIILYHQSQQDEND